MEFLKAIFLWVNSHHISGIPLDIPSHLFVGLVIFVMCHFWGLGIRRSLLMVFMIAVMKEIHDYPAIVMSGMYLEPIKDIAMTVYGGMIFLPLAFYLRLAHYIIRYGPLLQRSRDHYGVLLKHKIKSK